MTRLPGPAGRLDRPLPTERPRLRPTAAADADATWISRRLPEVADGVP